MVSVFRCSAVWRRVVSNWNILIQSFLIVLLTVKQHGCVSEIATGCLSKCVSGVCVRVFWQQRLLVGRRKCLPHRGDSTCQSSEENALIKHCCWQLWLSLPDTQREAVRLAGSRWPTHMHRHTHAYTHKLTLNSKIKPLNKRERCTLGT